jgi:excisionase family DNA binding protein
VPEYLNTPQVARKLGVNIQTVRGYIRSGELGAARVGRRYVITTDDVDRFIESRKGPRRNTDIGLTDTGRKTVEKVKADADRVMAYLDEVPGADSSEIAEALGIESAEVQRALSMLQGKKMVRCELDAAAPDRKKDPWYPAS